MQGVSSEFLTSILGSLPGVDTSDPSLQEAVNALSEKNEAKKDESSGPQDRDEKQ